MLETSTVSGFNTASILSLGHLQINVIMIDRSYFQPRRYHAAVFELYPTRGR